MEREAVMKGISSKMKLIRVEQGYNQAEMAMILGISKKTLVQIEKERTTANWTTIVTTCVLFRESEIIQNVIGENVLAVFDDYLARQKKQA